MAHDQRRGGVGLLRGRHRAVPHRRRHRVRAEPVRRGHRRRRLPRPRGHRHPRRDRPACGPTSASGATSDGGTLPHPRRHRPGRVHDGRQRQPLHQRDGALQPAPRGARPCASCASSDGPRVRRAGRRPARARRPARSSDWERAAEAMSIPFDEHLGIHPQDPHFLEREVWDLEQHAAGEAAAAAALPPAGDLPVPGAQAGRRRAGAVPAGRPVHAPSRSAPTSSTTTRSPRATRRCRPSCSRSSRPRSATTTSRCATSCSALFVDLADLHDNTADGVHVASTGGVWSALVYGFGGFRDHGGQFSLDPRLPETWDVADVPPDAARHPGAGHACAPTSSTSPSRRARPSTLDVRGEAVTVTAGAPATIQLKGQGPRIDGEPQPVAGPPPRRRQRHRGHRPGHLSAFPIPRTGPLERP